MGFIIIRTCHESDVGFPRDLSKEYIYEKTLEDSVTLSQQDYLQLYNTSINNSIYFLYFLFYIYSYIPTFFLP